MSSQSSMAAASVTAPPVSDPQPHNTTSTPPPATSSSLELPDPAPFYALYNGHEVAHLEAHLAELRKPVAPGRSRRRAIWLLGDSSLDNKFWLSRADTSLPVNGYPLDWMKKDVAFWMNSELVRRGLGAEWFCINTAVEATTISDRRRRLLPQDDLARRSAERGDIFIASIGSNDIALRPNLFTILSMLVMTYLVPQRWIERCADPATPEPSWWARPPGLGHFIRMFRYGVGGYLARVARDSQPAAVFACTIYYLDPRPSETSWASIPLRALGYDRGPGKLQAAIRAIYRLGTSRVTIPGVRTVPVALYEAMDGSDGADYVERVEPSAQGGQKVARLLVDKVVEALKQSANTD